MRNFTSDFLRAAGLKRVHSSITTLMAALSLIQLIRYGWKFGISAPLHAVLSTYNEIVSTIFDLLNPIIEPLIFLLSDLLNIEINPGDHWRHLFMLTMILLIRVSSYFYGNTKSITFVFVNFEAVILSFLGSLAAGSIQLNSDKYVTSVLIGVIPILTILIFYTFQDVWRATFERGGPNVPVIYKDQSWLDYFEGQFQTRLHQALAGIAFTITVLFFDVARELLISGLLIVPIYILGCAFHAFYLGSRDATKRRKHGESWAEAFWRTGNARIGAAVIGVYLWCSIILLLNAGLQLAVS